jgi:hypothetical protein
MKPILAALAFCTLAGSAAYAAKPAAAPKTYSKTAQIKYSIIKQMNHKYELGGASQNSQNVTLNKKTGKFSDFVFEGPGSPSPTIHGTVSLTTGKVTQSRIYNND